MLIHSREVQDVLERWRSGTLAEPEVHAWAEARYGVDAYEPETDACNAVLAELDTMNMNLLTAADIPTLIEALYSPNHETVLATLPARVDIAAWSAALRDNPFYAPFLRRQAHDYAGTGRMPPGSLVGSMLFAAG
jgi:hypothetical protein